MKINKIMYKRYFENLRPRKLFQIISRTIDKKSNLLQMIIIHLFLFFQNYINESLKYLDKSYPNTSLAGLHTPMSDTKPIYIGVDTKALLGHHVDNNKNNTK